MRILGIETSSRRGSVALVEDGTVLAHEWHEEPNNHAERLTGLLEGALSNAAWRVEDLDRVGVGVGPGSFTGVRIGVAFAEGVSMALGLPVVGVGALEAMVRGGPPELRGVRWAVLDARRDEVFVARFEEECTLAFGPATIAVDRLAALVAEHPGPVLGEFAVALALPSAVQTRASALPDAIAVALIAAERAPSPVLAVYGRGADAVKPVLLPRLIVPPLPVD